MKASWDWLVTKFWWLWAANIVAALLVGGVFVLGWQHESITAPNIPAWCVILAVVPALVLGSLWLRAAHYPDLSVLPLLLIPVPALVCVAGSLLLGVLYLLISLIAQTLHHGRVN